MKIVPAPRPSAVSSDAPRGRTSRRPVRVRCVTDRSQNRPKLLARRFREGVLSTTGGSQRRTRANRHPKARTTEGLSSQSGVMTRG
jgi:hypothetical protein